jgi:hemin uptake protein HemP
MTEKAKTLVTQTDASAAQDSVPQPVRQRREVTSTELFGDSREINIRHADEVYTLRRTNKGKLILTK